MWNINAEKEFDNAVYLLKQQKYFAILEKLSKLIRDTNNKLHCHTIFKKSHSPV